MNEVTDTPDHSAPDAAPEHPPRRRWRAALLAATLTAAVVAVGAVAVTDGTDDDPARPKSSRTHEGITAEDLLVGVAGEGTVYRSSDSGERWQGNDGPPGDLQALDVTPLSVG